MIKILIKNKNVLSITGLRAQALNIIEAGINRVLPSTIMASSVKYDPERKILTVNGEPYNLKGRLFVIGGGKASGLMAETLEEIIGTDNIEAGVVNCTTGSYNRYSTRNSTIRIKIVEAGHPIPDVRGINGVNRMIALQDDYSINENDLVICLISGGGSALMVYPAEGISLQDLREITELLLSCGADIHEINVVRKHISKVKGGRLGHFYAPATVVSLIISDVVGNDLDAIASGPTAPDSSTFSNAYNILKKYDLLSEAPESIVILLKKGIAGKVEETPKTVENLDNCHNYIIGDNRLALEAMSARAKEGGLNPYIVTAEQKGDTATMGKLRANVTIAGEYANYDTLLIGGETTPVLPEDHGMGGRNQHYAAVSMLAMKEYPGEWVVASVGTDGSDYLPGAAGAIVDKNSLASAEAKKLDVQSYIDRYDSNTLLKKIGNSLIITGDTGTNVGDIVVYILK